MTGCQPCAPRRFDPSMPHGRWARILRACADEALPLGDIKRAVRRPGEDRRSNKFRTHTAVTRMTAAGLLVRIEAGFIATTLGLSALASCGPPPPPAPAETPAADALADQPQATPERTAA